LRVKPPPPLATFSDLVALGERAERAGYDVCYVPEHYLNAVYGPEHPVADAWMVSAGIVARTRRITVVTAVQPGFKAPGVVAKMGATLAATRPGAFGLSILAGWWRREAEMHGDTWLPHAERYRRAGDYLDVVRALWERDEVTIERGYYPMNAGTTSPRPSTSPPVFVAGESEAAVDLAARAGDYLFVNGGELPVIAALAAKVKGRAKDRHGRQVRLALSGFALLRDSQAEAEDAAASLSAAADHELIAYFDSQIDGPVVAHHRGVAQDRLEANLGLKSGLIGDAHTIRERLQAFAHAGVDAVLLKLEPGEEHLARFAREVIAPLR
jgi:FMNH2-dependent dimethyl sulfone monooxygenase